MLLLELQEMDACVPPAVKRSCSHVKLFCDHCNCYVSKSTWYTHREYREKNTFSRLSAAVLSSSTFKVSVILCV